MDMEVQENKKKSDNLIKHRKRVKDYGEVYTPNWLVKNMVALTNACEAATTVLEPSCGNGNFLSEILEQKLQKSRDDSECLTSLKSVFGIDIQEDNVIECRDRLHSIFKRYAPHIDTDTVTEILSRNIVCGNFLTKRYCSKGKEIEETIWFLKDYESRLF